MPSRNATDPAARKLPPAAIAGWGGVFALVVAATGIMVLSDDTRLLRVGIAAALWTALIGAFSVARLRARAGWDSERAARLKQIYRLELEREVAARREYELEVENTARRQVAEQCGNDVRELRAELHRLRKALEPLLGGDLLFERVALRAQSTRLPASPAHPPMAPAAQVRPVVHNGSSGESGSSGEPGTIGKSGAHAEGTSVVDLLNAYGTADAGSGPEPPNRRRRRE